MNGGVIGKRTPSRSGIWGANGGLLIEEQRVNRLSHYWPLTTDAVDVLGGVSLTNNGGVTFGSDGATFSGAVEQSLTGGILPEDYFTLSFWFKSTSVANYIIAGWLLASPYSQYTYVQANNNNAQLNWALLTSAGNGGGYAFSAPNWANGAFHHFALLGRPQGGASYLYYDGSLADSRSVATAQTILSRDFWIGKKGTNNIIGTVKGLKVFGKHLTAAEIARQVARLS